MCKFLETFDSTLLWVITNNECFNAAASKYTPSSTSKFIPIKNAKRIASYLRKIKTKIKDDPFFDKLKHELRVSFQQINSKNNVVGDHFKFLIFLLCVRLFTILKSCKQSLKLKPVLNQNYVESSDFLLRSCRHSKYDRQRIIFYTEQIIDVCVKSLVRIFKETPGCEKVLSQFHRRKRTKRNVPNDKYVFTHYTVKSKIPVTIDEQTQNYVDNSYQETLILNFLRNSLPDLKLSHFPVENSHKMISSTSTSMPYIIVNTTDSINLPKPDTNSKITTNVSSFPAKWNFQSSTQLYPVPLLSSKPKPYKPISQYGSVQTAVWNQLTTETNPQIITESHVYWSKPLLNHNHIPSLSFSNWYNFNHSNSSSFITPPPTEDIILQFPYPNFSPMNTTFIPPKHEYFNEPFFVEPIVVSSVDQLPTNYPIPMENSSLSHNPVTVLVGSRPPEIVILEDVTFQSGLSVEGDEIVEPISTSGEIDSTVAVAADPPAAAAPAAIAPVAAAAAGSLAAAGAIGAVAGIAGAVGGVVGGSLGTGGAAAIAAGTAGAGGGDSELAASGGVEMQIRPTDAVAYSPIVEDESELEAFVADIYDVFTWFFSFEFLRSLGSALYAFVIPHLSFLLTSGFTVIAFMFPWMYPHIIIPLTTLLSSLAARSIESG